MNDRKRVVLASLPWALACVLLGGLWLFLRGNVQEVQWEAPAPMVVSEPPAAPPAASRRPVELLVYSAIWELPLFAERRHADAAPDEQVSSPPPATDELSLTGVMVAPPLRVAFIQQSGQRALTVRQGDVLPGGWVVTHIDERQVELSIGPHRHSLQISSPRLPTVPR
ncbi:type II secretion system protein N [Pseudomonas huaxiensis]|uniref:type II secretion system protein N n=1 Tax=Pseudomonas huaxiensis TaxID=2213017 RepID=UPI000DA6BE77|nr:type II secretion system protein N [Pseudomonas huaxiensis]